MSLGLAPVYTLHQSFTVECCSCPPLEPAATMKLRRQQILVWNLYFHLVLKTVASATQPSKPKQILNLVKNLLFCSAAALATHLLRAYFCYFLSIERTRASQKSSKCKAHLGLRNQVVFYSSTYDCTLSSFTSAVQPT